MKKILLSLIIAQFLIIPLFVNAAWWKPSTWNKVQATSTPKIVEKIVERTIEMPVEKIIEKPVEKIVTKTVTVDNPAIAAQLRVMTEKYNALKVDYDSVLNRLGMCKTSSADIPPALIQSPAIAPSVICQNLLTEIESKKSKAQEIIKGEPEQLSTYAGVLMVEDRPTPGIIADIKKKNKDAINLIIAETALLRDKFDILCK